MAKKDAQVTIGADASEVERAAAAAKSAWKAASLGLLGSITSASRGMIESLADVVLAAGKVNFSSQHESVKQFEGSTARLAISMGKDLGNVRTSLESVGTAIGKRPQEMAQWVSEVGKLTYSFGDARDAASGMFELSSATGRSVEDYRGLATTLGQMGVAGKNTSGVIGVLAAQADKLGSVGGVAALADQFEAAGEAVSHFASQGSEGIQRMTGFLGTLGKGLNTVTASRVQQQALGALTSDPRGWERYLGHHIVDEQGHVRNDAKMNPATIYKEIYDKTKKRFQDPETFRAVMMNNFGPELGMSIMHAGKTGAFDQVDKLSKLAPSKAPATAAADLMKTDFGKRSAAEAQLEVSSRQLMGSATSLGKAADALQSYAAGHPIASTIASQAGGLALSSALGKAIGASGGIVGGTIMKTLGGSGTASLLTAGGTAAIAPALALGAAGIGGVMGGMYLGRKLSEHDVLGFDARDNKKLHAADDETLRLRQERDRVRSERASGGGPHSPELGKLVGDGIKAGMSGVKFTIVNATGGPIDIVNQNSQSAAAGTQNR